jgi:hypothetical protein
MKKKLFKTAAGIIGLTLAAQAHALNIRLETPVAVKDAAEITVVQAYNDAKNCRLWYYMPGHQTVSGTFLNRSGISSFSVNGTKHFSYISTMDLRGAPEIQPVHLERLKQEIALAANADPVCKSENISKDNIVLTPALARAIIDSKYDTSHHTYYSDVMPTYTSKTNFVDPTNPISITYVIDASYNTNEGDWISELRKIQSETMVNRLHLGDLHYLLEGVSAQLDAEISVTGKMDATFASAVVDQGCDSKEGGKHLGGSIGGVGPGGAGVAGGNLGYSEKNKTCSSKLTTWLSDAKLPVHANLHMNGFKFTDGAGKPLYVVSCDERGKCGSMELENFARAQLWNLWLVNNFDSLLKSASDLLLDKTPGRQGKSTVDVDLSAKYSRSFYGEIAVEVPVYATNLSEESFDFSKARSPIATCANNDYYTQALAFDPPVGIFPIPVSVDCIKGAK